VAGSLIIVLLLAVLLVFGVRMYVRRAAEQRAAHDARLSALAQTYLAAARKKAAADAKAAANATASATPPVTPDSTAVREERECPFCAEPILKKARVCKHCGRDVEPLA
jgi:hypothetical protein